jgi:hypothetical protein
LALALAGIDEGGSKRDRLYFEATSKQHVSAPFRDFAECAVLDYLPNTTAVMAQFQEVGSRKTDTKNRMRTFLTQAFENKAITIELPNCPRMRLFQGFDAKRISPRHSAGVECAKAKQEECQR